MDNSANKELAVGGLGDAIIQARFNLHMVSRRALGGKNNARAPGPECAARVVRGRLTARGHHHAQQEHGQPSRVLLRLVSKRLSDCYGPCTSA